MRGKKSACTGTGNLVRYAKVPNLYIADEPAPKAGFLHVKFDPLTRVLPVNAPLITCSPA